MQTMDNQANQPVSQQPVSEDTVGTEGSFSITHRQIILMGLAGALFLLFILGLGIKAGERRASRKQSLPQTQPTPTSIPSSPTVFPTSTPTPTSSRDSSTGGRTGEKEIPSSDPACERDVDCLACFAVPGTPVVNCDAGRCVDGICVWDNKGQQPPPISEGLELEHKK